MSRSPSLTRPTAVGAVALVAAGLLAAPTATANTPAAPAAPAAEATAFTGPVFENGMSTAVFDKDPSTWIRQELWVEAPFDSDRDGRRDRIHVSLARPKETAQGYKVPVVYEDSPYYAGLGPTENWSVDHPLGQNPPPRNPTPAWQQRSTSPIISTGYESTWIPRGYAVVHSESPGTGLSDGCPTSGGRNESLAPKAVIDWLNGRAKAYTSATSDEQAAPATWTTGKVGMTGTSYNGTLPIGVATTGVKGLDAIIPVSAISNWYDYYRANGAVKAPGGYQGEDLDILAEAVYSRADRDVCKPIIDELIKKQDRATGDYSAFWAERDYMRDVRNIKAATLIAHGLNDWNVQAKNAIQLWDALEKSRVPHQIYLHQGGHGGAPTDTMMNRWFTRYLYDVKNGVEQDPKAYIVREGAPRTEPTAYANFPDPASRDVVLQPRKGGSGQGTLDLGASLLRGTSESLVDDASITAKTLAEAPASNNRLAYLTSPLNSDVRLSGTPSVSVTASFSASRANLTALLVQYDAAGKATILTRGWIDPRNRFSDSVEVPYVRGLPMSLRFDLQPKDSVIPAGSRLGLVILSSDNEFSIRPPAGTRVTVSTRFSTLKLPVVGGTSALRKALG